ncbi:MAG TPA: hypothetical protein VJV05_00330 [Pyrinomonadaceae bacterium]|nr:hypothetical protein [Pyrinomonadaceae bacterium]
MKYRMFAFLIVALVVLNLGAPTFADSKRAKAGANDLVAFLPASDAVSVIDSKRFFTEALPKLLANNPALLKEINSKIDDSKVRIGIDLREFDSLAIGATTHRVSEKNYDIDPVLIGRGQMGSSALIGAAKLASNGKYREEHVGERVMYIFDLPAVVAPGTFLDRMTEIAVAALDTKVIAFGKVARVRQTLEGKTRVSADLVAMLERNLSAVGAFAIKPPSGLKDYLPLENDELGKNIDSVQYLYGSATVGANDATLHVTARTLQDAQAKSLYDTLEGLQMLGKAFLGAAKAADKQVYARMIENVKFAAKGNEVTFDLAVPQSDIDILVGMIGK